VSIVELLEGADSYTSLAEVAAVNVSVDAPQSIAAIPIISIVVVYPLYPPPRPPILW
jgi:hypothetical protein